MDYAHTGIGEDLPDSFASGLTNPWRSATVPDMTETISVKSALVFIAILASLPQVYRLEHPGHWTSHHVFTVWGDKVCIESRDSCGASSRSYHTLEQARELWSRAKAEGFTVKDDWRSQIRG